MWLWESTELVEYSGLVNVSPGNPWVRELPGPLDITGCRMDIQEDDHLMFAAALLHLTQQHRAHSLTCAVTADGTGRVAVGLA